MSHKKDLLKKIAAHLRETYPYEEFKYLYETVFVGPEKQRIYPDIQVIKKRERLLVCIVEIGYTRPEKLEYYCSLNGPEVRWHSRDGRLTKITILQQPPVAIVSKNIQLEMKFSWPRRQPPRRVLFAPGGGVPLSREYNPRFMGYRHRYASIDLMIETKALMKARREATE
jgi:hypothetical protein